MTEHRLHFWRMGLDFATISAKIDYFYDSSLCLNFPRITNICSNLCKLFYQKFVFKTMFLGKKTHSRLRPEQKPTVPMQDILRKYSKSGALVFSLCLVPPKRTFVSPRTNTANLLIALKAAAAFEK